MSLNHGEKETINIQQSNNAASPPRLRTAATYSNENIPWLKSIVLLNTPLLGLGNIHRNSNVSLKKRKFPFIILIG